MFSNICSMVYVRFFKVDDVECQEFVGIRCSWYRNDNLLRFPDGAREWPRNVTRVPLNQCPC
jgi:hypothetical protein